MIPNSDCNLIKSQGEPGDNFYVIETGRCRVEVNGTQVAELEEGGSFGELALMYNAPRAATCIASDGGCTLWAMTRQTFQKKVDFERAVVAIGFVVIHTLWRNMNRATGDKCGCGKARQVQRVFEEGVIA
eukprot:SAG31_NODE_636_length_13344_cov_8.492451_5_plen_130_part_00